MVLRENSPLEMLRRFATYFKTKTSESVGAAKLSFNNSLGKGYISLYEVFPGLSVWVYNFNLKKGLYFTLEFISRGPIYFGYNVEGYQHHKLDDEEKFLMIHQNQNFIIKGEPGAIGHFKMPCNIPYKSCYLIVNPDKINANEGIGSRSISQNINDITTSCGGGHSYRHLGELDMTTGMYAQILVNNDATDLIGRLKTEGAVMNLLT
ncbi:hypothetical protein [Maribacter sp. 4G9]|uniref:hypothetical protein n=1 Tax=Maribacter sp. 4G9 TaxID=1889777 RepID=UPI000F4D737C|nr:hypothetical protein [Maribacter sp. 4G9]